MAGEVQLNVQTNKSIFPTTGINQLIYVLIDATTTEAVADVQMPLNFSLVLDHSGSMSGAKLKNLKQAAKLAIDRMGTQDLVSIIVFDDKVKVVVPNQPAQDKVALKSSIDGIRDGGGTEMSKGMRKGLEELRKGLGTDRVGIFRHLGKPRRGQHRGIGHAGLIRRAALGANKLDQRQVRHAAEPL